MIRLGLALLIVALVQAGCAARRDVATDERRLRGTAQLEHGPPPLPEPTPPDPPDPTKGEVRKKPSPMALPVRLRQDLPVYPTVAIEDRIAGVARILYHVETSGMASLVRIEWETEPAAHVAEFESAIRDAVSTWEFEPAYRIVFTEQAAGAVFEQHAIPHAAHAIVRFRVEGGKPVVD